MNDISHTQASLDADLGEALQRSAMIATCSVSMWSATVSDTTVVHDIKVQTGAQGDVGRFVKHLLAGADAEYQGLRKALNAARTTHYKLTLPWTSHKMAEKRGPRLLPNSMFLQYAVAMKQHREEIAAAKQKFADAYPRAVEVAKGNLKGMAPASYPTVEHVLSLFDLHTDFQPVPAGSGFKGLHGDALHALSQNLTKRTHTMVESAMAEVWLRVRERVEHIVERLTPAEGDEKAKTFHSTLISNTRELVAMLDGFNITGDPRIVEVKDGLNRLFDGLSMESLKDNDGLKLQVAEGAKRLQSKLDQWGV